MSWRQIKKKIFCNRLTSNPDINYLTLNIKDKQVRQKLTDWQLFIAANIICYKMTDDKRKRYKLCLLQVARGNGKTTFAAGLLLYDFMNGMGNRCHCIANSVEQADILLDTCRTMVRRLPDGHDIVCLFKSIEHRDTDCMITALPAMEKSLDGLNPSMWVADGSAEFKGRFLTKLLTTGAKRKQSTGLIISTPGSNPENIYGEIVKQCQSVLSKEIIDDTIFAMLYGADKEDDASNEEIWVKANPGMAINQPDLISLRRAYNTMKQSPMGRAEFNRFHLARYDENTGGWLDMEHFDSFIDDTITEEQIKDLPCYGGLDLSKTYDMTAFVLAFPLPDGRIFLKGSYYFPSEGLAQRELDYRIPVRTWAKEGHLHLSQGRQIDYHQIEVALQEACTKYKVQKIGYDKWGSQYLAENLVNKGVPLQMYSMGLQTFSPGCELFGNLWHGKKICFNNDPVLRRACAEAVAKRDIHGNVRPVKSRSQCIIDPLIASIIAIHSYGGKSQSIYELEAEQMEQQ